MSGKAAPKAMIHDQDVPSKSAACGSRSNARMRDSNSGGNGVESATPAARERLGI